MLTQFSSVRNYKTRLISLMLSKDIPMSVFVGNSDGISISDGLYVGGHSKIQESIDEVLNKFEQSNVKLIPFNCPKGKLYINLTASSPFFVAESKCSTNSNPRTVISTKCHGNGGHIVIGEYKEIIAQINKFFKRK